MEFQSSLKKCASQACTSPAIAADSYISSTNDQAHSPKVIKGVPPVSLSTAPWAAGQFDCSGTKLSETACDARGAREKHTLCMHGGASPPGDKLSIAAFQGHQLAPERLWFDQNAVDRRSSDTKALDQLPQEEDVDEQDVFLPTLCSLAADAQTCDQLMELGRLPLTSWDSQQGHGAARKPLRVPNAAHPRNLRYFSAPDSPADDTECTCDHNDYMYLRRFSVSNTRKNASLLHQAYCMSRIYSPTPLPCKKHFPGSGTWRNSNSVHIASQVLQGIQAPNREWPGTSEPLCAPCEQDTHTHHPQSHLRRNRSLGVIAEIASSTGSISRAASCGQAQPKRQGSRLQGSSVKFCSLPPAALSTSPSQCSDLNRVRSSSRGSIETYPTALLRPSRSQPAPGGRSHPHSDLQRCQSASRAVNDSLKSDPKLPPTAVKDYGQGHMQNSNHFCIENPSHRTWCTSIASSDGAPLAQRSGSLNSSTGASTQNTFAYNLPFEFPSPAMRPPQPSTSVSGTTGGRTLSHNSSWESSTTPGSATQSTLGAMSIQSIEERYGIASASGKLAGGSQDTISGDSTKQYSVDINPAHTDFERRVSRASHGTCYSSTDADTTPGIWGRAAFCRERYKDVFQHAKDTKREGSKASVDASENSKEVLEKYLDLNAYVNVRYEATEEQKNDPAYAHLVRALPMSVTSELAPLAPQKKCHMRLLDTWHQESHSTNKQLAGTPAGLTTFVRRFLAFGGFRKLLCARGGSSTESTRNPTEMKMHNSSIYAASNAVAEEQRVENLCSIQAGPSGLVMSLITTSDCVEGGYISGTATSDTPAGTSLNRTAEPTLTAPFGLPPPEPCGLEPIQESSMRESDHSSMRQSEEFGFRR